MELIDTHAHLYDPAFAQDLDQVIASSQQAQVCKIYLPNIDADTLAPMLALEATYPALCVAMIGIHPCAIKQDFAKQLYEVEAWLGKRTFAAMGEVGIDLHWDRTYQAQQEQALAIQLAWAKQYQMPIVIHCRKGFPATLRLLEHHQDGTLKGIFHCFSGTLAEAEQAISLGFYLGIGGLVTFKNAGLVQTVASIDLRDIVLETDSPYLAPTPYRGRRNEPAYLQYIATQLATSHQVDLATVAAITTANAKNVFKN
ncbi:MAG: TatD family hydrolase [Bacteroidota bacterium]